MKLFYGQVEPTPRHLGEIDPAQDDSPIYETQLDAANGNDDPRNIAPTLDPRSVTQGASNPKGMYQEMLLSLPCRGVEDVYWTASEGDQYRVYHRNTNTPQRSALVNSYPIAKDVQYWFDQTATNFRVFRVSRYKPMDVGGVDYGRIKSALATDKAMRIRSINEANRKAWRR